MNEFYEDVGHSDYLSLFYACCCSRVSWNFLSIGVTGARCAPSSFSGWRTSLTMNGMALPSTWNPKASSLPRFVLKLLSSMHRCVCNIAYLVDRSSCADSDWFQFCHHDSASLFVLYAASWGRVNTSSLLDDFEGGSRAVIKFCCKVTMSATRLKGESGHFPLLILIPG